jgi:hypothetical protein
MKHNPKGLAMQTLAQPAKFFAHNPTLLATFGGYRLWEHPTRGDEAPVYMSTPSGTLINTGFYDLGDFAYHDLGDNNPEGLALCIELESDHINLHQELGA